MSRFLILLAVLALELAGCAATIVTKSGPVSLFVPVLVTLAMTVAMLAPVEWLHHFARPLTVGMIVIAVALLAACAPSVLAAPPFPSTIETRAAICLRESRDHAEPALAVGDGGASLGSCQMSVETARWIAPYAVRRGYVPPLVLDAREYPAAFRSLLHVEFIQLGLAQAYLDWIAERRHTRDPRRLAYWYNAGHNSRFGSVPAAMSYAREVWIMLQGPPRAALAKIHAAGQERSKEAQDDGERNDAT